MIRTYGYDVEILNNFFSLTVVDVSNYLEVFKDCVDEKGKPVPLTQVLTVYEIKERLKTVKKESFYITDTDSSQLVPMLGYINSMQPHYEEVDGKKVAVRSDWYGYNSNAYDRYMLSGLLMYCSQCDSVRELIRKLYDLSRRVIARQDGNVKRDYFVESVGKYHLPFKNVDIMTIFALNKVGMMMDEKGKKSYFGKGLKQTSVNLQWYELLEYELPPISEKDAGLYRRDSRYRGMGIEELNAAVDKWDRYILPEWIDDTMYYNANDTFIVCEMIRLFMDEIRLRYSISHSFGIDVLSSSRSNIADRLFEATYSKRSGLAPEQWKGQKTERTAMSFKRVIFDWIKFRTKPMKELLEEMRKVVVHSTGKKALKEAADRHPEFKYLKKSTDSAWFEITINNLTYTIATGGLHSKDLPRELRSRLVFMPDASTGEMPQSVTPEMAKDIWKYITDDSYVYVHWDISDAVPRKYLFNCWKPVKATVLQHEVKTCVRTLEKLLLYGNQQPRLLII